MSEKLIYICNVIAPNEDDFVILREYLGKYPVRILRELPEEEMYFEIPTMLYGWYTVKENFPGHNIFDLEVTQNLYWNFSKSEDEKEFYKRTEDFFSQSVKKWLPNNFVLFDSFLNKESVEEFLVKNIDSGKVFLHISDGAMYIYNSIKNYIINLKSLSSYEKNFKKVVTDIINNLNPIIFSLSNIYDYVNIDELQLVYALDSLRWVKYGVETEESYLRIIPNFNINKYVPFIMSRLNSIPLDFEEEVFYKRMFERDKITCWLSRRDIAFSSSFETHKLEFKLRNNHKLARVNFSNKRTITGRIQAKDDYNPQNLPNDTNDRANIISRFEGGRILVYDYVSFEAKIALQLIEDEVFRAEYIDKDLHNETAKVLFGENITPEQRSFSKSVNNALLYGASEETLIEKLATHFENPEHKLYDVRQFLKPIIKKADEIKLLNHKNGYLKSPWGYIVKAEKKHASFNNYMQMYASEIVIDKTIELREFLKPYKSQYLFQVHDSLVFDICPEEEFLVEKIHQLLLNHNGMRFAVDCSYGSNYKEQKKLLKLKE